MSIRRSAATIGAILGLASASCEVITEVMPVSVNPIQVPTSPPIAARTPTPTELPPGTAPPPVAGQPPATRQPKPKPKPQDPDGEPTNVPGCPKPWPPSCQPVASLGIVTFWVLCGADVVPNSKYATSAPAHCQVKLDSTPKDASRIPTQSNNPVWSFNLGPGQWVGWGGGPFNPTVHGGGQKGQFTTYATVDGVRSNDLVFHFN